MRDKNSNEPIVTFKLTDLFETFRRKWPLMLALMIVVNILGAYIIMKKQYIFVANAKIAFWTPDPQLTANYGGASYQTYQMTRPYFFATQIEIIKSEPVAKMVAEALNLIKNPKDESEQERVLKFITGSLSVSMPQQSHIMNVSSVHPDPVTAMKIANATAEAYIKYNDNRRYAAYKKSIGGITEQLVDLEQKLEEAQKELIAFIEKEKITSYGDTVSNYRDDFYYSGVSTDLSTFVDSLSRQKVEAEINLAKMREKYYDAHPKIQRTLEELKILTTKIREEEAKLQNKKRGKDKEIIASKQKEIQYTILRRKVEVNKQIYDTLIKKLKEADIGSEVRSDIVDIIEYAKVPKTPFKPNKSKMMLFTFMISIFSSFGLGFLVQYMDTSFKNTEDLQAYLDYPLLSVVPMYKMKGKKSEILLHSIEDDASLKEAFRLLRTNLKFALSEQPAKSLMVTSSQKGEGKSTVSTNLALVMAEAGTKTLLVDCDLRVRAINKLFGISADVGLSDYLNGSASFEDIIVKTSSNNLWVVPSGANVNNPSILFESQAMKDFLKLANKEYDQIILDSPPVGYVIDSALLSTVVDGVLMVVEAGVVSRKAVMNAIEQLMKGKAPIHGVVFNKEMNAGKNYYYKYYSYYSDNEKRA